MILVVKLLNNINNGNIVVYNIILFIFLFCLINNLYNEGYSFNVLQIVKKNNKSNF